MAVKRAFKYNIVFLTTISHVVWGMCIHYDCGMSDTSCFSAHAAVHDAHSEHDSSSERVHTDSCHSEADCGLQQSKLVTLVIPCRHGDRHEETPHQHGPQCVGNCAVYLPKLPSERQTFLFSRLIASCPSVLKTPAGHSNFLTADISTGSGDFQFKSPLHPLLTVLLL